MKIIGIDPGVTTGWALIDLQEDHKIKVIMVGNTKDKTLVEIKDQIAQADHIVYEGWRTRPTEARKGAFDYQSIPAEQVIGSLLTLCKLMEKTNIEEQPASTKPVGYGFSNQKYRPGMKGKHWQDAFAHAVYYAVKKLQAHPVTRPTQP